MKRLNLTLRDCHGPFLILSSCLKVYLLEYELTMYCVKPKIGRFYLEQLWICKQFPHLLILNQLNQSIVAVIYRLSYRFVLLICVLLEINNEISYCYLQKSSKLN